MALSTLVMKQSKTHQKEKEPINFLIGSFIKTPLKFPTTNMQAYQGCNQLKMVTALLQEDYRVSTSTKFLQPSLHSCPSSQGFLI